MSRPAIPDSYRALINSPRVSTPTRIALQSRDREDDPAYLPVALTGAQLNTLRAILSRALPQPGDAPIDLAARLDAQLAAGEGDGWRFADLPADRAAYAAGLSTIDAQSRTAHGVAFPDLAPDLQDALLTRAAAGALDPGALDAAQIKLWFQDLLADAAKLYMAHPATLARIGYSGIAYGGDGPNKPGFTAIGLGEREPWEPAAP